MAGYEFNRKSGAGRTHHDRKSCAIDVFAIIKNQLNLWWYLNCTILHTEDCRFLTWSVTFVAGARGSSAVVSWCRGRSHGWPALVGHRRLQPWRTRRKREEQLTISARDSFITYSPHTSLSGTNKRNITTALFCSCFNQRSACVVYNLPPCLVLSLPRNVFSMSKSLLR